MAALWRRQLGWSCTLPLGDNPLSVQVEKVDQELRKTLQKKAEERNEDYQPRRGPPEFHENGPDSRGDEQLA